MTIAATNTDRAERTSGGFSGTSLVTGVVGLCLYWVPILGAIFGFPGTVFRGLGWHQHRSYGRPGFGLAIASLTCGIIAVLVQVVFFALVAAS